MGAQEVRPASRDTLRATSPDAVRLRHRLGGVVYDSLARAPLANAIVQLVSLAPSGGRRAATSDGAGRFTFDSLAGGPYALGFFHAKLDSLGIDAPLRRVEVGGTAPVDADLAVPSAATVVGAACGRGPGADATGIIVGHVRDVVSTHPIERALVRARWSEIVIDRKGTRAQVQQATASTSGSGWFGLCGVPPGALVVLRAFAVGDSGGVLEVEVPQDGLLVRDVYLPPPGADAAPPRSAMRGFVHDAYGAPMAGARLRLFADAREVKTDERGEFAIADIPPGTQMVEARAIGFVPHRVAVDLFPSQVTRIEVRMEEFATDMDTVRVLANKPRVADPFGGFEKRRRLGHGVFLDPDAVEMRRPLVFTDLLRGIGGVEVIARDMVSRSVAMRGFHAGERCEPVLVIDGMRIAIDAMSLDDLIPTSVVKAIEVYPRRIQAPPEFQSPECGTIVVWTGARGWLARALKEKGKS